MLSSVEQAFVGRDEKRAPLKTPAWEAILKADLPLTIDWKRVYLLSFPAYSVRIPANLRNFISK